MSLYHVIKTTIISETKLNCFDSHTRTFLRLCEHVLRVYDEMTDKIFTHAFHGLLHVIRFKILRGNYYEKAKNK